MNIKYYQRVTFNLKMIFIFILCNFCIFYTTANVNTAPILQLFAQFQNTSLHYPVHLNQNKKFQTYSTIQRLLPTHLTSFHLTILSLHSQKYTYFWVRQGLRKAIFSTNKNLLLSPAKQPKNKSIQNTNFLNTKLRISHN